MRRRVSVLVNLSIHSVQSTKQIDCRTKYAVCFTYLDAHNLRLQALRKGVSETVVELESVGEYCLEEISVPNDEELDEENWSF